MKKFMKDINQQDLEKNIPLVTRKDYQREVKAGLVEFGKEKIVVIAGPCTIESKTQVMEIAKAVKDAGAKMLRGGAFKPLTFPYGDPLAQPDSNSGQPSVDRLKVLTKKEQMESAEKRLSYLAEAGAKYGLPVVAEIIYADSVAMMEKYVDMFQVGYRHMWNMDLIDALSKTKKPLLLKRHYGESLRSLLGVAEHYEARNKHNFAFVERGVAVPHTHNPQSRAVIDIQAIPALKEFAPSVPVIVDPSHSTFKRIYVSSVARAAIAAGADGLLIDIHPEPEKAWVDPLQALDFKAFEKLMTEIEGIAKVLGKTI
ncbi:MAG: DAHP synthetase I/KDSA [Parcubacteria group bacterium Gr01-1014_30]|nr:MAG: DAHP synthetase I/KDSA [Parcubacteria group bacterium Gr01-1014_30]